MALLISKTETGEIHIREHKCVAISTTEIIIIAYTSTQQDGAMEPVFT